MSNTHVVSALRRKRAEISGHINNLEERIARQRANLANLDATIKLFSPGANPDAIPPKRADSIRPAHVGSNGCRRHASEGNAARRCGVQGNRRGAGAYRVAAAREARGSGEVWDKPRRQMGGLVMLRR
jgi:hypothetical protein